MKKIELAKSIVDKALLKGKFQLRSGVTSEIYFDKYRFESDPILLKAIAKLLAPMIPPQIEVLAGLEMGGIPIATALSLQTGLPVAFIRKEAKEYGTCQFAEGVDLKGKKVCLIEDVITSGGAVVDATAKLRSNNAQVEDVLCVIYRGKGPAQNLKDLGLKLKPLFEYNHNTNELS